MKQPAKQAIAKLILAISPTSYLHSPPLCWRRKAGCFCRQQHSKCAPKCNLKYCAPVIGLLYKKEHFDCLQDMCLPVTTCPAPMRWPIDHLWGSQVCVATGRIPESYNTVPIQVKLSRIKAVSLSLGLCHCCPA